MRLAARDWGCLHDQCTTRKHGNWELEKSTGSLVLKLSLLLAQRGVSNDIDRTNNWRPSRLDICCSKLEGACSKPAPAASASLQLPLSLPAHEQLLPASFAALPLLMRASTPPLPWVFLSRLRTHLGYEEEYERTLLWSCLLRDTSWSWAWALGAWAARWRWACAWGLSLRCFGSTGLSLRRSSLGFSRTFLQ